MRLRTAVAAVTGAFAIATTIPGPANAAEGMFLYLYQGKSGSHRPGALLNPPSRGCVDIPEVTRMDVPAAHTPHNRTDSTAVVFTEPGCEGDYYVLRPNGGSASERLKLRSVSFS